MSVTTYYMRHSTNFTARPGTLSVSRPCLSVCNSVAGYLCDQCLWLNSFRHQLKTFLHTIGHNVSSALEILWICMLCKCRLYLYTDVCAGIDEISDVVSTSFLLQTCWTPALQVSNLQFFSSVITLYICSTQPPVPCRVEISFPRFENY